MAVFIAFEGGDAAGKSTQTERLVARLDAVRTREPGGTPVGAAVRAVFLDPDTGHLDAKTEALLMAADRAQHAAAVIRPALAAGRNVVSDRYLYSSVAYQAHGRGLDPERVRALSLWATDDLEPDLVVYLDLAVETARARVAHEAPDRLESEDAAFHERVRAGFLAQAAADPTRWLIIDATETPDAIAAAVWAAVTQRLASIVA